MPAFVIVGLPDRACAEARQRVKAGITSAELEFPRGRVTVNLAPAGLRKEGSGYDLPIALAVPAATSWQVCHGSPGWSLPGFRGSRLVQGRGRDRQKPL